VVIGIGCYPEILPGSTLMRPSFGKRTSELANATVGPFALRGNSGYDRRKQTSRGRASMCTSDRSEHFTDHMWRLSQS